MRLPIDDAEHLVAHGEAGMVRLLDDAGAEAADRNAEIHRRQVGRHVAHSDPHAGIHRDQGGSNLDFTGAGRSDRTLAQLEIGISELANGTRHEYVLTVAWHRAGD